MKKTASLLGLSGAGLVILVAAAVAIAFGAEAEVSFAWVIVPAVIMASVVSVAVMALVAVSYTETRPTLSGVLYFIAAGFGLVVLWITGLLFIGSWGYILLLAVAPLLVAGVLTHKGRNRIERSHCSNTIQ